MRIILTWALLCASVVMAGALVSEWLEPTPLPLLVGEAP